MQFIFLVIMAVLVAVGFNSCGDDSPPKVKTVEDCFSAWDGSYFRLENYVEDRLKDPDSYEHIKTAYGRKVETTYGAEESGTYVVHMQYRAKNSFGGYVIGNASAIITEDCKMLSASSSG